MGSLLHAEVIVDFRFRQQATEHPPRLIHESRHISHVRT
jgi:hypothetical protein